MERVDSSQPRYPRDHAPGSSAIGTHFDVANWKTLAEASGFVRVEIPLLPWLKNPLGQLFGGFTPAFADILAARVVRSGGSIPKDSAIWYATTGMRVDYLEPIVNPTFEVECQLLRARGKSMLIEARFYQEQALAAFAVTTMLAIPR